MKSGERKLTCCHSDREKGSQEVGRIGRVGSGRTRSKAAAGLGAFTCPEAMWKQDSEPRPGNGGCVEVGSIYLTCSNHMYLQVSLLCSKTFKRFPIQVFLPDLEVISRLSQMPTNFPEASQVQLSFTYGPSCSKTPLNAMSKKKKSIKNKSKCRGTKSWRPKLYGL